MAYTNLTTTFIYKGLLTWQQLDALAENDAMMIRTDLGGQTITPASAVAGLIFDQNEDARGIDIDTESISEPAYYCEGKQCFQGIVDITGGYGIHITRADGLEQAEANPLIKFRELNAECTQAVVEIENAGSGNDATAPNFSLKNGYIAPGGNEALRWDIVELNMDVSEKPESVAYALDGLKCKGLYVMGYEVDIDDVNFRPDNDLTAFVDVYHDGANLVIDYGAAYVDGDDARVIIFTTV